MKKIYSFWLMISFISVFIIGSLFTSIFLVRNRLDVQNYGERFVELRNPVRFQLEPNHDSLNIVVIPFKNPALINKSQFEFSIYSQGEAVRKMPFSGFNIGDPSDVKFQFEPIENSKNKTFEIEIKGENYENPILVNIDSKGMPAFNTYYRTSDKGEIFQSLFNGLKVKILNSLEFFIVLIIILSGIIWWSESGEKVKNNL